MNQQPELKSDALRSEIDTTRERMDETIDALGNRLEGRHFVDELIGFFRGRAHDGQRSALGERISHTAETAVHTVVDTVKTHPVPTALIGAGVAWLVWETRTRHRRDAAEMDELELRSMDYSGYGSQEPAAEGQDVGLESPGTESQGLGQKAANLASQVKEKLNTAAALGHEKLDKFSRLSTDVQARGREIYGATRQSVVTTADEHPLELGLGCLAAGVLLGLAIPTPHVVNRGIGPTMDRLRDRTREAGSELLEKGKRVVQSATTAARAEAKTQGLSVGRMREAGEGEGNRAEQNPAMTGVGGISGESAGTAVKP